jgi:hypothetical protein
VVVVGAPEGVAMKVTGHGTPVVFDPRAITSLAELQDVGRRLTGTIAGTLPSAEVATRPVGSDNSTTRL